MLLTPALLGQHVCTVSACAPSARVHRQHLCTVSTCALHSMSFAVPGTQSGARLTLKFHHAHLMLLHLAGTGKMALVILPLLPFLFQLLSGSLHVLSQ